MTVFSDANFYNEYDEVALGVTVLGEALVVLADGTEVRTAAEFREAFPDGNIPEDGTKGVTWINNRWYEDQEGNVAFYLEEL